jgi:hypothetical protein
VPQHKEEKGPCSVGRSCVHAGFRSRRIVTSETALIYTSILWLIGKRDFGIDLKTLRGVIGRRFFMARTTGRATDLRTSPPSDSRGTGGR